MVNHFFVDDDFCNFVFSCICLYFIFEVIVPGISLVFMLPYISVREYLNVQVNIYDLVFSMGNVGIECDFWFTGTFGSYGHHCWAYVLLSKKKFILALMEEIY
jgi:hypothetical protein